MYANRIIRLSKNSDIHKKAEADFLLRQLNRSIVRENRIQCDLEKRKALYK